MLRTDELDYDLPEELIATHPAMTRDEARLLVLRRSRPGEIEHLQISDLPDLLAADDRLILNNTRVIPARLIGQRADTGGKVEGLYLHSGNENRWRTMLKSNGRLRPGMSINLFAENHETPKAIIELIEKNEAGEWLVQLMGNRATDEVLTDVGRTPLPPYILRARERHGEPATQETEDRERYQTVFAGPPGAVAAPTAGLHFTPDLLATLESRGIRRSEVTLHVGAGTFKPVEVEVVEEHPMHFEEFEVSPDTLRDICSTKEDGGRLVAVGTTAVRTLESLPDPFPVDQAASIRQSTNLLITPGYTFRHVDVLLTNFHLPRSTLLALVAAFISLDEALHAYRTAVDEHYRFYSYGDAMLILP